MNIANLIAVGFLAACSSQSDAIGAYIASDTDGAMMVQITSADEGKISGTVSIVGAVQDGKNIAGARPFSGTIDGKAINLSIENGTGVSLATGAIEGDKLRLTWFANGSSTQATFEKSDAARFGELADASRTRAAEKRQDIESLAAAKDRTQRRSETQKSIEKLADKVFSKANELSEKSRKIDVLIAGYQAARNRTAKMKTAIQHINAKSPEGSYQISQINYQMNDLANDIESIHISVQNYRAALIGFANDAGSQSSQHLAECQTDRLLDCSRLSASMLLFQSRYKQFQRDYQRENTAYNAKSGADI